VRYIVAIFIITLFIGVFTFYCCRVPIDESDARGKNIINNGVELNLGRLPENIIVKKEYYFPKSKNKIQGYMLFIDFVIPGCASQAKISTVTTSEEYKDYELYFKMNKRSPVNKVEAIAANIIKAKVKDNSYRSSALVNYYINKIEENNKGNGKYYASPELRANFSFNSIYGKIIFKNKGGNIVAVALYDENNSRTSQFFDVKIIYQEQGDKFYVDYHFVASAGSEVDPYSCAVKYAEEIRSIVNAYKK
jgi:hypothetical protein